MAKRFRDTEKGDKEWYMKLPPHLKCAVDYIHDKCDVSGVWDINMGLLNIYVGGSKKITEKQILEIDEGRQFDKFKDGKIYCVGFIQFQYGTLSEKSNPHLRIISTLKKHGIYERVLEGYLRGTYTPVDKEEDKDKDKEVDKDKEKEKEKEKDAPVTFKAELIHPLQKYILESCPQICTIRDQLTYDEALTLISNHKSDTIQQVLDSMENYKDLAKKYVSVYLTINNWCNRRKNDSQTTTGRKSQFSGNNPSDIMQAVYDHTGARKASGDNS